MKPKPCHDDSEVINQVYSMKDKLIGWLLSHADYQIDRQTADMHFSEAVDILRDKGFECRVCCEKSCTYDGHAKFIYRAMVYRYKDARKKDLKIIHVDDMDTLDYGNNIEVRAALIDIFKAIEYLSQPSKEIFISRAMHGIPYSVLAEKLNLKESNVRKIYQRAKTRLQEFL